MKFWLTALCLLTPLVAQAKNDPPVYNLTGTVTTWVAHYDYTSTVTVDGRTSSMGCNVSDTHTECDDVFGGFWVKLADGRTYADSGKWSVFTFGPYGGEDWQNVAPIPVSSGTFQYRLMTIKGKDNLSAGYYACISAGTFGYKNRMFREVCKLIATPDGSPVGLLLPNGTAG
jgi:hypothetical protein